MSLTESKSSGARSDINLEGGGIHSSLPEWSKLSNMFLRNSSNLAVVGFPTSLHPYDIAYVSQGSDAKTRQLLARSESLKSHVAMVMHERYGRTGLLHECPPRDARVAEPRIFPDVKREVVGDTGSRSSGGPPSNLAMKARRSPVTVSEPERQDFEEVSRLSSPSPKKLKFGIDTILASVDQTSEKRKDNKDLHETSEKAEEWKGEMGSNGRAEIRADISAHHYREAIMMRRVSKPAPRRPSGLSSIWGRGVNNSVEARWEGAHRIEVGPVGWTPRGKCREYHDLAPHHNPYHQWPRNAELNTQPPYTLPTTLPPSHLHPTLPRSYHHPVVHVPSTRPPHLQDGGDFDVKSNIGGGGGVGCLNGGHKRKRSWSRAVFTSLQRKGLEKRFEMQKYVNKPERRQLASALGLSDAQVKVWFQNRRMKWRHSQQFKRPQQEQHAELEEDKLEQETTEQPLKLDSSLHSDSEDSNNNEPYDMMTSNITMHGDSKTELKNGAILIGTEDEQQRDDTEDGSGGS